MTRKRLLIVSPHFPPINAPDMQRVRMSLPHFAEFGWEPTVLAAESDETAQADSLLCETIPADVPVERVGTIPSLASRFVGARSSAVRAIPALYLAGSRLLGSRRFDLVYFSTSIFLAMPLGRLWKRRFGVPYVLDFQDPWLSDYYETHPESAPPPKYGVARRLHAALEPWTLKEADGIIAVSPDYIATLHRRYPWLLDRPSMTLPFGASQADFDFIDRRPQPNHDFRPGSGRVHGVYAGRGGDDLSTALDILFRALSIGLEAEPALFAPVALHFIGTDYAERERARKTVEPRAERAGVGSHVREDTTRRPYFETLQLLKEADFLMIAGSDDPAYTASKLYPYILARKPLLAVVHERSTVADILRETRAGSLVTFPSAASEDLRAAAACRAATCWRDLLAALPCRPDTDWLRFERYTAREMTRRQCALFDEVTAAAKATAA
jgi:Glycosyl transferase 4-like domain